MSTHTSKLTAAVVAAAVVFFTSVSHATILTFDIVGAGNPSLLNTLFPDYGDNVTATTEMPGGNTYHYGEGNGFTPNVVAEYSGDNPPHIWAGFFTNGPVATNGAGGMFQIDLVADPGFEVVLHSFDLNGCCGTSVSGDVVASDGTNTFTDSSNPSGIVTYDSTDFGTLQGSTISISFDDVLGSNFGLDNIDFSQVAIESANGTPEPMAVTLGLLSAMGLAVVRRGRDRSMSV